MAMAVRRCSIVLSLLILLACAQMCKALTVRRNPNAGAGPQQTLTIRVCSKTPYPKVCREEMVGVMGTRAASQETSFPGIVLLYTKAASARVSETLAVARGVSVRIGQDLLARGVEKQALKDCIQLLSDAQDELNSVVSDLHTFGSIKGADRRHRISDVRTWASAGLTDQDTCSDEMSSYGESQTQPLKIRLSYLSQVISNALYLLARLPSGSPAP